MASTPQPKSSMAPIRFPFCTLNSVLVIVVCFSSITQGCVERERVALLDFKKSFASFPQNHGKLSSWSISSEDCCGWEGVKCGYTMRHVEVVDLSDKGLESHRLRPSLLELQHLTYLDLSDNNLSMRIPEFIGSFKELSYLDLSDTGFYGSIPPQLANLSTLDTLYLGPIDLSAPSDWLLVTTKLPLLSTFWCDSCSFPAPDALPTSTTHVNSSSSQLQELSISDSIMSSSTLSLFLNTASNLSSIELDTVQLEGPLLNIIHQIGKLCNLELLSIYSCGIKDNFSRIIQALGSGCARASLQTLDLSSNNLSGFIPSMLMFHSLTDLDLGDNQLEGFSAHVSSPYNTHPSHIFPPTLSSLSIADNALRGVLVSEYFANMSQLHHLDLTNNPNLTVILSEPPSQVQELHLSSCNLGPGFPSWILSSLQQIGSLDLSNSNLSGSLPTIFWSNLSSHLFYLNLSSNNLFGVLPNFLNQISPFPVTDLSSNGFYGTLPLFFLEATELHLSNNNFSSFAPLPYPIKYTNSYDSQTSANTLDISNNNLFGEIPNWAWIAISAFKIINLSNNSLSGEVPSSFNTTKLYVLNLSNNKFAGQIPSFLKNSTNMMILDLSKNSFSGLIPSWIGEGLNSLVLLSVESNNFTGTLPRSLCQLRSLQILDLSHNKLSGTIPSCVSNLVAMTHFLNSTVTIHLPTSILEVPLVEAQFFQALVKWKGMDRLFHKSLELLNLIDLSSNNLSGEIPGEVMSLIKLESLDMSSNNFTGSIPSQIGQLKDLEYLNLSFNTISGPIPAGLADITSLGMLDLSHNNLSGRIPKGIQLQTFDSSDFTANSGLCGEPLEVKCPGDVDDSLQPLQLPSATTDEADEGEDKEWFYAGSGAGFACGFLGIIATLTWIKEWRYAFFGFATELGEWMLLVVALGASRISRKLRFK